MENIENSLILNLSVENDLIMSFLDNYNDFDLIKQITDHLKKIFLLNGFVLSKNEIKTYFLDFIGYIFNNLKDNTIKTKKDLKFYIISELCLTIENNNYLFFKYFENKYKYINDNYLFVEIE